MTQTIKIFRYPIDFGIIPSVYAPINNFFSAWFIAIRPKTLPAAAAPVIVGSALAFENNSFGGIVAVVCLLCAIFLQIGSNLANDVFDFEKGADAGERLGPTRVTQAGILTPRQVKTGMWIVFGITAIMGLFLIMIGGWPVFIIGIAAIISAIAYTGGPYPLGYHGLGDLFVFIFFGLAATAGTYYLHTGLVSAAALWMAAAMGSLTVSILVVNNLRDIESDRKVKKLTLAVRYGAKNAKLEYIVLVISAYGVPLFLMIAGDLPPLGMLTWLSLPLTIKWIYFVTRKSGRELNKALAGTGAVELLYALLFAAGMLITVVI
jgi:1,4-dihydroxy-2-naphthoate octaprenyltransferase